VVIASGETSDELLERAKSIGVSAIVSKQDMFERIAPVTQEVLAAMRRAAVRRASRRKASGRPGV
jgi:hypothetical protein